ncbi:MAG: GAF domain-containing sensor histidine kinase [Anaerolineae bacterium]|nr:GAF domain-containing sensor histidine kinase [Anaerolineae bacterium]
MIALNKSHQPIKSPLKLLLPTSTLDDLIPPFESLFSLEGQIGIHDIDGNAYYGAAVDHHYFDVFANIDLSDGTTIAVVGIYNVNQQFVPVVNHLAQTLSLIATEIWRRRQLTDEVLERYDELNLIYDLGMLISTHGLSQNDIVKGVLEQTNRIVQASSGVIYLYSDDNPNDLIPVSSFGQQTDEEFWKGRLREFALSTLYAYEDTQLSDSASVICVPLRHGNERLGALVLIHDGSGKRFSASDVKLLTTLSHNTALFIQAARLYDRLMARNQELVKTLEELQTTREKLSRNERLSIVGQTVSGLIHDMRNPLSIVMGYAGLMQDGGLTEDEIREYSTQIIQYISVFSAMAEEVLEYTRSDERLELQNTSLETYLTVVESLTTPPGLSRPVSIVFNKEHAKGYSVRLDTQRFTRVFQNLVNNAIDAIEEHGGSQVVIDAVPTNDGMIQFSVCDDGPGIPEDMVDQIFEPFITGKAHGTGLGLAIVNRMIARHGGTIHYETGPAGGACFVFTIPQA